MSPQDMKVDYKITVDERKPAGAIAREIARRLLPDYEAVLTAAWDA
jgi:hypothetical protein